MRKQYPAVLAGIGGGQIDVVFPDFPGCVTVAETVEDAFERAAAALSFHLQGMLEDGEPIPAGGDEDALLAMIREYEADGHRVIVGAVVVDIPDSRARRINVTLPEFVVQAADRWAREHGQSRSSLLAMATMDYLKRRS